MYNSVCKVSYTGGNVMTQKNRQFIEKTVKVFSNILVCSGAIIVLIFGVWLFIVIGSNMHLLPATWHSTGGYYVKLVGFIAGAFTAVTLLLYLTLKIIFKINDDSELREQAPSPLINVTTKQEKSIIRLLTRVATRSDGSDKINRAHVAMFLATLKNKGLLNDGGDVNNLRLWVERETGLFDSDKVHFTEAYHRAIKKKGDTRYTKDIEEIL